MLPKNLISSVIQTNSKFLTRSIFRFSSSSAKTINLFSNQTKKQNIFNYTNACKFSLFGITSYYLSTLYNKNNNSANLDAFYEVSVKDELKDGERRAIQVGPKKEDAVMLVRLDGKYYCVSDKCPHFGAPMSTGPMYDDKVMCPWHNATFSVIDGKPDVGPMFNGLATFPVTVKDGQVHIKVAKDKLNVGQVIPMTTHNPNNDKRRFVIIGGGVAGLSAAETLRQSGFEGEITILSKEEHLPYDRTGLSKFTFGANINNMRVRDAEFLKQYGINVQTNVQVTSLDSNKKVVQTKNGESIQYDRVLIATGGSPRRPPIPGATADSGLQNVHVLREYNDAIQIQESAADQKHVVIVGASFIGLESASALKSHLKDQIQVTVVDIASEPYERVLGTQIGHSLQNLHQSNGVQFQLKRGIQSIQANPSTKAVSAVVLDDGTRLDADFVLLGTGIAPNTAFVSDIKKNPDGTIPTDALLRTSNKDVFAAGDVTTIPFFYTGENVHIEHHNQAIYQGHVAGLNMLDQHVPLSQVPFFWTRFWDQSLQYTGFASTFDEVFVDGDLSQQKFLAWYFRNNQIVAAAGMQQPGHIMTINEAMKSGILPTAEQIQNQKVTMEDIQARLQNQGKQCRCSRGGHCHKK